MDQLPFVLTVAAFIGLGLIEALIDSRVEAKAKARTDQGVLTVEEPAA